MVTPLYSFRLNPELKAKLAKIAKADGRTLSYVIDKALTEFVRRHRTPREPKG